MSALLLPALGRLGLRIAQGTGGLALVTARAARALPRLSPRELLRAIVYFGYESLQLALVVAVFTGGILVLVTNANVQRYGAKSVFGWAAGYALLREFGPLLMALVMAGRIGARNAAELASMRIGGQLEGLRGLGVDPFALLVAPRLVASAVSIACVGMMSVLVSVLTAAVLGN
ncbi:MAG: MlaE family ABC transporter permease, partial [Myxococcales bacterium]